MLFRISDSEKGETMTGKITAVILSAGSGKRMHADRPKQYLDLCGRPVIAWTIEAFERCPRVSDIVLVAGENDIGYCRREVVEKYGFSKVRKIVPGGDERGDSVLLGLRASDPETAYALVHDGARPLIDQGTLDKVIDGVIRYHAAVPGIPAKDTVKVVDEEEFVMSTPQRSTLRLMQTPQAFSYRLILDAYEKIHREGIQVTDDSMAAEYAGGVKVRIVEGSPRNIKITTPEDLVFAEELLTEGRRM